MANARSLMRVVGGGLAAALIVASFGDGGDALAAKTKRRARSKSLALQQVNVRSASNVPANQIVEMVFSGEVDPSTVSHAVIQVRERNATDTGYTKEVFGTFQVTGNIVRFFPRLPTHLRDPNSPTGAFYASGSLRDNAAENAGFQPSSKYEIRISGSDALTALRSRAGRPLRRTESVQFSTAAATDPSVLYTTTSYQDSPPPQYSFSNPPDRTPAVGDSYTHIGGTTDVPADLSVSLFCTKVPLSVTTARILGNVEMTLTARNGNTGVRRPAAGDLFIEQNFATTLMSFKPKFPLTDIGTYTLRVSKAVKDLTEQYDFQANRQRETLRAMYDWLAQARADNPNLPASQLPDPPADLIVDWPDASDPAARGVLKENLLALADAYPDEVDPRVMVMFTTRDEPVSNGEFLLKFLRTEDLFDGKISTGEWDQTVPDAASAIMTIAGGSAANGDFLPVSNTTLNMNQYPGGIANFRDVVIPQGVTVTLVGDRPAQIRAINFTLNGSLNASGRDGDDARRGSYDSSWPPDIQRKGGQAGPGGGDGGASSTTYYNGNYSTTGTNTDGTTYRVGGTAGYGVGNTGDSGVDENGGIAVGEDGGQGGLGGKSGTTSSTAYILGGGGGGGGGSAAGQDGADAYYYYYPVTQSPYATWAGLGGKGGLGSANDDLVPLVGGGGGGSGGNGTYNYPSTSYQQWTTTAGGGGGAGGALLVQTARTQNVGTDGKFLANGGDGGDGTGDNVPTAGPAGAGGGGSILLRSTGGFQFASPTTALSVVGGKGGNGYRNYYSAAYGGDGGEGYTRTEDPDGGLAIPGATQGNFDPVGGGVPSIVYSKFADLGVDNPRILNPSNADIDTSPTTNDAIFVEIQATREHPSVFGTPDVSAIDATQGSSNESITSQWMPLKVHDATGVPGGVFTIPGYDPGANGTEYAFPINQLNNKGYRFVRFRITFQLDDTQSRLDPLPYVDTIRLGFQFNF